MEFQLYIKPTFLFNQIPEWKVLNVMVLFSFDHD